jgi:thioester reductase-like protein
MAPLTLEGISKDESLLDEISQRLKMLLFSGGSLPKVFGDVIATKIKLTSLLGSSESGPIPTMYPLGYNFGRDWNYIQIHPALGAKFEDSAGDVAELVWERSPETEPYQTVFTIYPDLQLFRTKDLFTPHSELANTWTHASRSDDVIVFLHGEKINPIAYESNISKHSDVSAALMFGHQRFEPGLLIEPVESKRPLTTVEKAQFIQRIWPSVEYANSLSPGYAQVSQSHILFTDSDMPILRTLKGSIRRAETLKQYATKIASVYDDVDSMWTPVANKSKEMQTTEGIENLISSSVIDVAKWNADEFDKDTNFFDHGIDSLQVLRLVRHLRGRSSIRSIQPSTIYLHPTVSLLATALQELASDIESSVQAKKPVQLRSRQETLDQYTKEIDAIQFGVKNTSLETDEQTTVVLTGSTGSIGSYILRTLLENHHVRHIYCLNRSSDSVNLQQQRNKSLDSSLPTTFPKERVTFLKSDLSDSKTLGLTEDMYTTIQEQVTLIIHNAWRVDFNIPLQSFNDQLAGVVGLSSLCAQSSRQAAFVFLSSISAVMDFDGTQQEQQGASLQKVIPETVITDINAAAPAGYAESKYIAERLLAHAAERLSLRNVSILRLGQIAGSAKSDGLWNVADWVPSLVLGSKALGVLPSSLQNDTDGGDTASIDWLTIDTAADVIAEISLQAATGSSRQEFGVFNVLNPQKTSWKTLLPSIITALQKETNSTIQVVPPTEWIERLKNSASEILKTASPSSDQQTEAFLRANPALKLIDFFDGLFGSADKGHYNINTKRTTTWETSNAERASGRLRDAEVIDGVMIERWTKQWCAFIASV